MTTNASIFLLAVLAVAGCKPSSQQASRPAPTTFVQTIHPQAGEIVRHLTLPGRVRAMQEATLYAKVGGYLKTIAVDRGDAVREGDVLATIEIPEMLADLAKVNAEAEAAQLDFERTREAQKKAPDLTTPQSVDNARARLRIALAARERVETMLGFAQIKAPFAGIVTRRWVDPGAFIPAATASSAAQSAAILAISDFSTVRVEIAVPDTEAAHVKTGLPAKVMAPGLCGHGFAGAVTRIAYALDEATRTMPAEIAIPNPELALRPGMWVSVQLDLEKKSAVLLIPAEALVTEKAKSSCFIAHDGKAQKVPVKLGFDDGIRVEIVEGLTATDAVVISGKQSLSDGQPVKTAEAK